jgi:catechol 2,3-dioxygenase-like lactoylglutathione lyase family enzyme
MRDPSVTKVKLLYTGIRVTDLERSLVFYKQGLGLTEIDRGTMSHGGVYVLLEDRDTK